MELEKLDLNVPAEVHWRNPSPYEPAMRSHKRRFPSLRTAVRFVIEDLTDVPQLTASIATDKGPLNFEDIRALYKVLSPMNH